MSALFEARVRKREIEELLAKTLQEFTEDSGLLVGCIDLTQIDVTDVGSEDPMAIYKVDLDIRVLSSQHF